MSDLVGNPEDRFSHNKAHINEFITESKAYDLVLRTVLQDTTFLHETVGIRFYSKYGGYARARREFESLINQRSVQWVSDYDLLLFLTEVNSYSGRRVKKDVIRVENVKCIFFLV